MSVRTTNYKLINSVDVDKGNFQYKTVPAGSYVKPVEFKYIPDHLIEQYKGYFYDEKKQIFVYTRYGFVLTDRNNIEEE